MQTGNTDKPRLGYAKGGKIQCMADGGLVKAIKSAVDRLTTQTPQDAPLGSGAATQAKTALTTRKQVLDDAERKAMGMAGGGKVPGKSPSATADNIPIMATAGEFMVKKAAVDKLGVQAMEAINSVADGDTKPKPKLGAVKRRRRGKRRMAEGGELMEDDMPHMANGGMVYSDGTSRNLAPYVNHRPYTGGPPMPQQPRLTNGMPPPGSSVATVPRQGFTYGPGVAPNQPPPAVTDVTPRMPRVKGPLALPAPTASAPPPTAAALPQVDVQRQAWQGRGASPQAEAFQAEKMARPAAAPAGTAPPAAPQPAAAPASTRLGAVRGMVNKAAGVAGGAGVPLALGATAAQGLATDTEQYAQRFGLENTQPGVMRDVGVRALGVASDLGNTLTGGLASNLYRDQQGAAAALAPAPAKPALGAVQRPATGAGAGQASPGFDDARRVDRDPARASLGASRDFTQELGAVPKNLPSDLRQGVIYKTVGPNGNPVYSGANVGPNAQMVNGLGANIQPRGGGVNTMAAGAFGNISPQLSERLSQARDAAMARGDFDAVKASYGGDFGPKNKTDPIDALINNGKPMTVRKAAAIAQLQSARTQQEGNAADRALTREKFDLEAQGLNLDNKGKAQLGVLRDKIFDDKTPEPERKSALARFNALTGKTPATDEYAYAPGGQVIDQATGAAITQPGVIFNKRTGETRQQGQPPGAQEALPPKDKLVKGQQYNTPRGMAVWDGSKFVSG